MLLRLIGRELLQRKAKKDRLKEEQAMRAEAANRRFDESEEAKRVSMELEQRKLREKQEFEKELLVQQRILDEAAENKRQMDRLKEATRHAEQTGRFETEQRAMAEELNLERLAIEESTCFTCCIITFRRRYKSC